jgi:hypothetical protein
MRKRKKPGWAFWLIVALIGLPVLYVASFGPACWITSRCDLSPARLAAAYRPMMWVMGNGPGPLSDALVWYSFVGSADDWAWRIDETANYDRFDHRDKL